VSLTPCKRDGRQRPVDVTCCERCEQFPKCVPSASPRLIASIEGMLQAGKVERDTIAALLNTLQGTLPDADSDDGEAGAE